MKKHLVIFTLCLFTAALSGCALFRTKAVESPKVEIVKGQWIQLPQPAQLKFNLTATQILTATYNIKNKVYSYTSQVQVEKTPEHLILVAVAGWGGEIFSINYNGITIKTSSLPMPHANMGVQHVLTDFILTYASSDLLKSLLNSTKIKLKTTKYQRVFLLHNKPIIKINYKTANPWAGPIVLQNLNLHYTIKIATVTYKKSL